MVNNVEFKLREAAVRRLLADKHLDVTEGARLLGLSRCYFSQLLNGGRRLSPRVRRLLLARSPFLELAEDMLWERVPAARRAGPATGGAVVRRETT